MTEPNARLLGICVVPSVGNAVARVRALARMAVLAWGIAVLAWGIAVLAVRTAVLAVRTAVLAVRTAVLAVRTAVLAVGVAALVLAAGCGIQGIVPSHLPEPRPAEAIVVLGNRPPLDEAGRIRPELRRRLDRGIALFEQGLAPRLVMAGGPVPGKDYTESETMRRYALARGVPDAHITLEPHSHDTIENAGFTVRLLCRGVAAPCIPSLIVVSARFHLVRARHLFECAGAEVQVAAAELPGEADSDERQAYERRFVASERMVRLMYGFIDPCARARHARANGP